MNTSDGAGLESFQSLPAGARRDLLRVLSSPSIVRADVIRQFHERGDEGMVEILAELEAEEILRLQVIALLRRAVPKEGLT